jgi:hypothetical protein
VHADPTWLNLVFKSGADFGEGVAEVVLMRLFDFDGAISMMSGLRPAVCGCSGIVSGGPSSPGFGTRS